MTLAAALFLTGCDADNTPSGRSMPAAPSRPDGSISEDSGDSGAGQSAGTAHESADQPVLAAAPWFKLPEDWDEQHPVLSPNAKLEAHWTALAEREIEGHPGDGGGRAWLEAVDAIHDGSAEKVWRRDEENPSRPHLTSSSSHRFTILYEVGPHGIQDGGLLFVWPEAFWYWTEAQTVNPEGAGYTTARSLAEGVLLEPIVPEATFRVTGRDLAPGERIEFVYGGGPRGAQVDRYAEQGSEIMIGVDADGDGFRRWIEDSARVDVAAQSGHGLVAHGPAEIAPGQPFEIQVALVDRVGNRADWPHAELGDPENPATAFRIRSLESGTLGLANAAERAVQQGPRDAPRAIPRVPAEGHGTIRLRVEGLGPLEGWSVDVPPIVVRDSDVRLVWGDLHGHSQLSDGTGTPDDYFRYARDVARLDVVALTDHDHWGPRPLDDRPAVLKDSIKTTHAWHEPGRFVTLPGYEWTSWLHGHRHVLYFGSEAPIYSAIDPETDRPDELWAALRGQPALTFAHHSAGEPIAVNWFYPPDPVLEPLTEIASVHGMSEAPDAPVPVEGGIPGYFVRDTLQAGYRLGFIGSGDSHDGHPGLAQIAGGQAGLAGLFTRGLDRAPLLEAMRRRHTFATNGIRPWLEVSIDDTPMGGTLPESAITLGEDEHTLRIHYEATSPVTRVDLIRGPHIATLTPDPGLTYKLTRKIPRLDPGEFHYIRIHEKSGGTTWSSPIFAH